MTQQMSHHRRTFATPRATAQPLRTGRTPSLRVPSSVSTPTRTTTPEFNASREHLKAILLSGKSTGSKVQNGDTEIAALRKVIASHDARIIALERELAGLIHIQMNRQLVTGQRGNPRASPLVAAKWVSRKVRPRQSGASPAAKKRCSIQSPAQLQ